MSIHRPWRTFLFLAAALAAVAARAEVPEDFLRLSHDDEGRPQALQVALARYQDEAGRSLHLIGAVHVADRGYFKDLDRRFDDYDVVLYELVGDPEGGRRPSAGVGLNLVGLLQGGMKEALGLAFQLEEINYDRDHFVHADMTAEEFSGSMRDRDESWMGTFMQLWAASLASSDPARQQAQMIRILISGDRQLALKRAMAESMLEQMHALDVLSDEDGSVLITERNRKALSVLERQLETGAERIALFYGAGHLPDFHRRLAAEHGFELRSVEWLEAWNLRSD